jgi:predicted nucleic acid-binding protein
VKIFLDSNVLVAASEESHPHHAQAWPALGWPHGRIRGSCALLIGCAIRCKADRIYTFDIRDFRQLAPTLEERICAPA